MIALNTGVLVIAQILEKIVNFFIVVILVKYLSEGEFGQYGFVSSYVILFSIFINLGVTGLSTREMSRKPELTPSILTAVMIPVLFSSILTFAIISWSIALTKAGQTEVINAAKLAAAALILSNITDIFGTIPRSKERMIYTAIPRLIKQLTFFLLCILLLPKGIGLTGVFRLLLFAGLIELLFQLFFSVVILNVLPSRKFDITLCKRMLKEALPLAIVSVSVIIYYKIDSVMLSYMQGDRQVALYTAAYNLAFAFLFLGTSFNQAVFPVLSKLYINSHERLLHIYRLSAKYLTIIGLPISAGMILLSHRIVILVYGENYIYSSKALQILMIAFLFMFINGLMGNALISAGNQKGLARIVGRGALINVSLNLLVIPIYGFTGAASTTVITEFYSFTASWLMLKNRHNITAFPSDFIRPILSCAIMSFFVISLHSLPLYIIIPSAAAIYFSILYISGGIGIKELSIVKSLYSKEG